jgi:hypothetical protein
MSPAGSIPQALGLRPGEWVFVRPAADILGTLDASGCLDGLPFMPEMLRYCGQRVRVYRRADKTCDTIDKTGSRRMLNAVHLAGVRCDGGAHGGCQAACLVFWKEAWLQREPVADRADGSDAARQRLTPFATRPGAATPADTAYVCQATELTRATTALRWWDPRQYARELLSGNWSLWQFVRTIAIAGYNAVQRRIDGSEYPRVPLPHNDWPLPWWDPRPYYWRLRQGKIPLGTLVRAWRRRRANGRPPAAAPAPPAPLNLVPGDRVRVRSLEEIAATLSPAQRHRGLWFDVEMTPYCGGEYRVQQRVHRIINERTGKMIELKNDCLILEDVVCQGCLSRNRLFCSRAIYSYWREAWLERVE